MKGYDITLTKEDIKKSFVGFNEDDDIILKLEPDTVATNIRHKAIIKLHREGKLKDKLKEFGLEELLK